MACLLGAEGGGDVIGKWERGDEYQGGFVGGEVVLREGKGGGSLGLTTGSNFDPVIILRVS